MLGNVVIKYFSKEAWISFIAILFFILPLISQEAGNISIQYTNYNTEDGLPNQLTNCTFQDSRGFFWIATNYGFSRFDGKTFVNYSPDDLGVPFGTITGICEDIDGNLWLSEISHESSLPKKSFLIFNPDTETIKFYQKPETRTYYSIASTPDKKIVLGTEQGKLLMCDTTKEELIYELEDKRAILQTVVVSDYYWLNSGEKLTLIKRNGEFVQEWSASHKFTLLGSKEDNVYVREIYTSSDTLKDRILLFKTDESIPETALVDKLNIASEIDEKWKYFSDEEKFVRYNDPRGLSIFAETAKNSYFIDALGGDKKTFNAEDVYFGANGFLWVSSISGVYKIQITSSNFESFLHKDESLNYSMRNIMAIGDSLYCNTYSGNIIYDLKKKELVRKIPENDIGIGLSSIKASDGCIYSAGTGIAVQKICDDNTSPEFFLYKGLKKSTAFNSVPRDYWAILEDSKKQVWFGTNQGLFYLDHKKGVVEPFEKYNQFIQLSKTLVFDIIETESAYWIASQDGLYKMEGDKGITSWYHSGAPTPDTNYLPIGSIFDIHEDEEGYLWLTTYGSGLVQFNPKNARYKEFTVKEGLPHNVTSDILEDDFGNLWISTNKGLACFNRKSEKFINFDKSDGLHIDEFNKKASVKLEDGSLIFGGLNGCVVFHPKDFLQKEKEEAKSNLRIIQLIIDDTIKKAVDITQPIVVKDTKVDITFDLHLLEFMDKEAPSYQWKWKDDKGDFKDLPSFQRYLSEVPSGKSTIVFKAKSAKGTPALNELEVSFLAPQLFSLSQIIIGIAGILATYFFLFFRERKAKSNAKWKQKTAAKRVTKETDESIAVVIEIEEKNKEKVPFQKAEKTISILAPADKEWLNNLTSVIQKSENIGQFSVEDMAREVNLSSRQLNRRVKQLTGITPNQFLRSIKLEKAKALLESGAVSTVAEVSLAVGFEKPDYFSRLFQEKYGKRPVTYFDKNK